MYEPPKIIPRDTGLIKVPGANQVLAPYEIKELFCLFQSHSDTVSKRR